MQLRFSQDVDLDSRVGRFFPSVVNFLYGLGGCTFPGSDPKDSLGTCMSVWRGVVRWNGLSCSGGWGVGASRTTPREWSRH